MSHPTEPQASEEAVVNETSSASSSEAQAVEASSPAIETSSTASAKEGETPAQASPAAAQASEDGESHEEAEASGNDDGSEQQDGPDGPEGPSVDGAKKRRRRKRKKPAGAQAGPEGPPVEEDEASKAAGGKKKEKSPKGKPPANRERAAFTVGEEVFGKVTSVTDHAIMVDLAGKALAIFDRHELNEGDLVPDVNDRFVAVVHNDGNRGGLVVLTRKPLREEETRPRLEEASKSKDQVMGLVTGVIKGGIEVDVEGIRAFAPASHVDLRLGADLNYLIAQYLPFVVEQYSHRGRDIVLSRKSILEEEFKKQREGSLAKLTVDQDYKGIVKSVVQWGAFVAIPDADNVEGLVHASEASHDPRAKLHEVFKMGAEIQVKVLKIDEKGKLWLSKKAAEPDPWQEIREKYAQGTRHKGTISRLQPFGAFINLEEGLDGLIHIADLSIKRVEHPQDVVQEGEEIEVIVASLDAVNRKIGLHPAPPEDEAGIQQKVAVNKSVKVRVVSHETGGLIVRIVGKSGRNARGFVPAGHTGTPRGTDFRKKFPLNSELEGKVIDLDSRRGEAKISIRALREDSEKAAYNQYKASVAKEAKFGTFGDLLKKFQVTPKLAND
jgi:small subunit ribosomal protein S1